MDLSSNAIGGAPGREEARYLDIRPPAAFQLGHRSGAVSLPVSRPAPGSDPDSHFESALPSIFLPPREVPLVVVGDDAELTRMLATHLLGRGRTDVRAREISAFSAVELAEKGPSTGHLWEPPRWLSDHAALLPPPAAGPALDLGCGNGRAAVWLAERGYRVTGVDWQAEALAFGRVLAESRGVTVDFREADLRRLELVPSGPWAVILNFRYLQRDLVEKFPGLTSPGGVVMLRTFREAPGYRGHPRPRHRLAPGELLKLFPAGYWQVLAHDRGFDPDRRPATGIVARRHST